MLHSDTFSLGLVPDKKASPESVVCPKLSDHSRVIYDTSVFATYGIQSLETILKMDVAQLRERIASTLVADADARRRAELDLKAVCIRNSGDQGTEIDRGRGLMKDIG